MNFSIKDFFRLRIWSHLLKKFLIENFIFCAVKMVNVMIDTNVVVMTSYSTSVSKVSTLKEKFENTLTNFFDENSYKNWYLWKSPILSQICVMRKKLWYIESSFVGFLKLIPMRSYHRFFSRLRWSWAYFLLTALCRRNNQLF